MDVSLLQILLATLTVIHSMNDSGNSLSVGQMRRRNKHE